MVFDVTTRQKKVYVNPVADDSLGQKIENQAANQDTSVKFKGRLAMELAVEPETESDIEVDSVL